jgi:hypothetical protein
VAVAAMLKVLATQITAVADKVAAAKVLTTILAKALPQK